MPTGVAMCSPLHVSKEHTEQNANIMKSVTRLVNFKKGIKFKL